MTFLRAASAGVLAGLIAVLAVGWVISLFVGGGSGSDAVDAAFYASVMTTASAVAFGVSRRSGAPPSMAWLASALAAGTMLALGVAFYIIYFEFLLGDDAFRRF
ncbi:MAG: hypothetical protein AABM66_02795 [Actinomycetota bacterium]